MNFSEPARVFAVEDALLLGIVTMPEVPVDCGVLMIVGGPQYRVGSHRQFLLLSRYSAAEGYSSLRVDYRGMCDSGGDARDFESVSKDIEAAVNAFLLACPAVKRIVLWGLCDAASAALLYLQASNDARVAGVTLLNPWVRSEASLAQTHIKHYYGQRLLQREFWVKLLSGKMQVLKAVYGLLSTAQLARGTRTPRQRESQSFQDRMAEGLKQFPGKVLLILSGQDYTAKEFLEFVGSNAVWSSLMGDEKINRVDIPDADHTFSSSAQRSAVEVETLKWLGSL